jgi:putative Mn2+ efflux pump MntP
VGIVVLGLLVGLDNLAVATSIGMLGLPRRRRLLFATACAAFEMVMPLVGFYLGAELRSGFGAAAGWLAPACLVVCGLLVFVAAVRREASPRLLDRPAAMAFIPLALSLDNLAAGAQLGTSGGLILSQAAVVGAFSGGLCLIGFALGERVRLRVPRSSSAVAAVWLFGCAALFVLADRS